MNVFEELPDRKFDVIYADPPWNYKDKANDGKRGASHHYNTVSIDDLKALPVGDIAADNAVLFMWVTPPTLLDALKLAEAWGFTYITKAFCWVKTNKDGSFFRGMGHYVRANSEDVLLFRRGKTLERTDKGICQVVSAPRREHSRKPDEVRDRIKKLYANASCVELFARIESDGWHVWGNETSKFKGE